MANIKDISQRVEEIRKRYMSTPGQEEYDELPFFTTRDSLSSRQNRRVKDDFSTLLIVYGEDGEERSISPEGTRFIRRECPRTGWFHKHEYVEILYVIEGSFSQVLLGEQIHFEQGEFVITDQNCEHADYIEGANAAVLFLQIRSEYLGRLLGSYDGKDEMQRFLFHALWRQKREQSFLELKRTSPQKDVRLEQLLESLVAENLAREPGYQQVQTGYLIRMLQYLCQDYSLKLHSDSQAGREKAFLYELEYYIRLHAATVTTGELEERFHYHRNYYSQLLKKYRGKSFREYVIDVRMRYARQLLEQTTLPVKRIAQQIGYENMSHFYHLFEAMYRETPREVRKR